MTQLTDSKLVEDARLRGNKQAFGMLLERYHSGALRMAKRMIAHEESAREVTQEAMLEAYLSLASLEKPERFQSWLYGIVINLCRNYLRRQPYDPLSLEAISGGLEASHILLVSHAPDPQRMVEMRELHELVLSAIRTLSPQNQEATFLYYYEQLSLREISLLLGISMTAVKGRLHKSRRQLANYLTTLPGREAWFAERLPSSTEGAIQERKQKMVEVQLVDVIMPEDEKQGHHVVILHDKVQQRILPIWIGPFEAHHIALQLLEAAVPRPMTYDFMANLLKASGAVLEEVQISGLQEFTYFATAMLRVGGTVQQIDARPSDAMALALRWKCKISVAEDVMAKASKSVPEKFRDKLPLKGLEQLTAKMEESKRQQEETLAKMRTEAEKQKTEEEENSPTERIFAHIFGE